MSKIQIHFPANVDADAVIDLTRYRKNPVLLLSHQWASDPIGTLYDIEQRDGEVHADPKFHCESAESCDALIAYAENPEAFEFGAGGTWDRKGVFTVMEISLLKK